jgi:molybdopterin-binding protein
MPLNTPVVQLRVKQVRRDKMLSARNQFKGMVKSVKLGTVMAEVIIEVNGLEVVSLISRPSATSMNLKTGDAVTAIIKSTEVMVSKEA